MPAIKDGRELVREAIKDTKSLKEAALEAAKNQLIEGMSPKLKQFISEAMGALDTESRDRTSEQGADYYGPATREKQKRWEEGKGESTKMDTKNDQELDMESLAGFFPQMEDVETDSTDHVQDESMDIPTLGEESDCGEEEPKMEAKDEDDKEKVEETYEISEAELKKMYAEALQMEVQVKKGFGEPTKSGELADVIKDVDKGLADVKKGESSWEKAEPPAKEDFTVKEMVLRGIAENKKLRENLKAAVDMIREMGEKLHEVNLFNSKILHVNRILNQGKLTKEQREVVLEQIDKASSINEVKVVYETIVNSFAAAKALTEGRNPRKPTANAQRPRTSGSPDQKVLRESVDRAERGKFSRLKELAGLTK